MPIFDVSVKFIKGTTISTIIGYTTGDDASYGDAYTYQYTGLYAPVVGQLAVVRTPYGDKFVEIVAVQRVEQSNRKDLFALIKFVPTQAQRKQDLHDSIIQSMSKLSFEELKQLKQSLPEDVK